MITTRETKTSGAAELDWHSLADAVLSGTGVTTGQAEAILASCDDELPTLLSAAFKIRRRYFGKTVQLYMLMNAKSGICPEDCGYCSQSKISKADIPQYNLLSREKLMEGAKAAAEREAKTFCMVISGRSPTEREMKAITTIVPEIKAAYPLKICACLGLLSQEQAEQLKACGVDRVNHNLNTAEARYAEICSTHTYRDRINTLDAVRKAGLELCSGGILGMGESHRDLVEMAMQLRALGVHSIPLNFLIPIEGTPLSGQNMLNPRDCLRALCMFRFTNPSAELRIAGGREVHLRTLQPLGLYPANSIFVGDYLTTAGQPPVQDMQMIQDLGFEIVRNEEAALTR